MIADDPAAESYIPSPCVGICIIGAAGFCIGCFRARDELQRWWTATTAEKLAILACCRQREVRPDAG
jgi:uncharacterized protein